jgi:hypothetical protein
VSRPLRLRAPQQDGAVLAEPPLSQAAALITANRRHLASLSIPVGGLPFAELRRQACAAIFRLANQYLGENDEPGVMNPGTGFLLSGHQPELFHSGVWVKNFALNGLARKTAATPLNLIVDNDTAKSAALHLPTKVDGTWHRQAMPLDRWESEVPYEERAVLDEDLFASLVARTEPVTHDWPWQPLLADFWREVVAQAGRTPLLGERLVAGRRALERRWGCQNLEVPVSRLCGSEPFARFAWHLLNELPRLHEVYNGAVQDYRRANGIRSRNHPVPDLVAEGDWLEAPFWAWRAGARRRGRLLARTTSAGLELRVQDDRWPTLPADPDRAVATWQALHAQGFKVRSRALTTTLFARLFLADLFIHGIGGAKYDELTDAIIRRFFGIEPPAFLVLTATLLLPFPVPGAEAADCRGLERRVRDLHYNPQRYLEDGVEAELLVRQKQDWIDRQPTDPGEKRERFQRLRQLTEQLRKYLGDQEPQAAATLAECRRRLEVAAVLRRRDYAFCLFPEAKLRPICRGFLGQAATHTAALLPPRSPPDL